MLVLLFIALWFILRSDLFYVLTCVILFLCFSVLLALLGKERANLCPFHSFVRFAIVCFCLFPLPLGVWEELWFVIVAVPGLFSYLFFHMGPSVKGVLIVYSNHSALFNKMEALHIFSKNT